MLKAGNLARREDHRVRGVKSGRTQADWGISHIWIYGSTLFVQSCLLEN